MAWNGRPVDIIIDMDQTDPYSSVTVGLLSNKPSHIFLPQRLAVAVSEDGETFTEVAAQDYEVEAQDAPDAICDRSLSFPATSARYIKVTVVPVKTRPQWHYSPGGGTFSFIDEIMVL